jgi:hypothetical protein
MGVTIGICIVLFIGYRIYNFNKTVNSVLVHENTLDKKGVDCGGRFTVGGGNTKLFEISDNQYTFSLTYKDFIVEGIYIFKEKLRDTDVRYFFVGFEKENENEILLNTDLIYIDRKHKSIQISSPHYYFKVNKNSK